MARIRTIKPDFFTSKDIVRLPLLARLLYLAIWCECDREGRLVWDTETLKLRYFPIETFEEVDEAADALILRGHVRRYLHNGVLYAFLPTFTGHQSINNKESASKLPSPDEPGSSWVDSEHATTTRYPHVPDATEGKGREWKGKERKGKECVRRRDESEKFSPTPDVPLLSLEREGDCVPLSRPPAEVNSKTRLDSDECAKRRQPAPGFPESEALGGDALSDSHPGGTPSLPSPKGAGFGAPPNRQSHPCATLTHPPEAISGEIISRRTVSPPKGREGSEIPPSPDQAGEGWGEGGGVGELDSESYPGVTPSLPSPKGAGFGLAPRVVIPRRILSAALQRRFEQLRMEKAGALDPRFDPAIGAEARGLGLGGEA